MVRTDISDILSYGGNKVFDALTGWIAGADQYFVEVVQNYLMGSDGYVVEGGTAEHVLWLHNELAGLLVALFIGSIMFAGIQMVWTRSVNQPARELIKSMVTLLLVSVALVSVINVVGQAADAYSAAIIKGNSQYVANLHTNIKVLAESLDTGESAVVFLLCLGMLLVAVSVLLTLIARPALIVVLAGVLPLSAAASNTSWGRNWFQTSISWIISFLAYKPAAATIIALGTRLAGFQALGDVRADVEEKMCGGDKAQKLLDFQQADGGWGPWGQKITPDADNLWEGCVNHYQDLIDGSVQAIAGEYIQPTLAGVVILGLAAMAMPALIRFITPSIAGQGSAGNQAMMGMASGVATGAIGVTGAVAGAAAGAVGGKLARGVTKARSGGGGSDSGSGSLGGSSGGGVGSGGGAGGAAAVVEAGGSAAKTGAQATAHTASGETSGGSSSAGSAAVGAGAAGGAASSVHRGEAAAPAGGEATTAEGAAPVAAPQAQSPSTERGGSAWGTDTAEGATHDDTAASGGFYAGRGGRHHTGGAVTAASTQTAQGAMNPAYQEPPAAPPPAAQPAAKATPPRRTVEQAQPPVAEGAKTPEV